MELAYGTGRRIVATVSERLDERLRVVGIRGRWVTVLLGDMWIKRRVYPDRQGEYRYLLYEIIGLERGS